MPPTFDKCIARKKECETLTENEVLEFVPPKEILVEESNVRGWMRQLLFAEIYIIYHFMSFRVGGAVKETIYFWATCR